MNDEDQKILLAKIDALRWSFADTQLQAIAGVMHDLVLSIQLVDKPNLGFTAPKRGDQSDGLK